jgi:hypothetical protein
VLPAGQSKKPLSKFIAQDLRNSNSGKWGHEVHIGPDAYSKVSYKPGTRGKICIAHQAFYDLSGLCIGFTPGVWCGCPDKVQVRAFINEIEDILAL